MITNQAEQGMNVCTINHAASMFGILNINNIWYIVKNLTTREYIKLAPPPPAKILRCCLQVKGPMKWKNTFSQFKSPVSVLIVQLSLVICQIYLKKISTRVFLDQNPCLFSSCKTVSNVWWHILHSGVFTEFHPMSKVASS